MDAVGRTEVRIRTRTFRRIMALVSARGETVTVTVTAIVIVTVVIGIGICEIGHEDGVGVRSHTCTTDLLQDMFEKCS